MPRKPSIHNLSKVDLRPEDKAAARAELLNESDRAAAMVACSLADLALVNALASHFVGKDDEKARDKWFFGKDAVLKDMASRIDMALALGIIGTQAAGLLKCVKKIRNAFAHTARAITFDEPAIREACSSLPPVTLQQVFKKSPKLHELKERYISTCLQLQIILNDHADRFRAVPKVIDIPNGP
jgi:hypothetical protein